MGFTSSAQKTRLVADLIRGKSVAQALNILNFSPKKAAGILKKAVESAIANAEHNDGADIDELKVTTIYVDKAQSMKRFGSRQGPWQPYREADLPHHGQGRS